MVNPDGDPDEILDGDGEWFELYNDTDFDINIVGWTFWDEGADSITIEGDLVIAAGGYLVLGNNDDVETNGGVEVDYTYEYGSFRLANTDDEFIVSMGETEIFSLSWVAADWPYSPGYAMGWDWEGDITMGESWCAQASVLPGGDYGTPGEDNDSCDDLTCALSSAEVGVVISGDTTTDYSNDFETDCGYGSWGYESGPDDAYVFTADEAGCYEASVDSVSWGSVMSRWSECGGTEKACETASYDFGTDTYSATLQRSMEAGDTALLVVDGRADAFDDYGPYDMAVDMVSVDSTWLEGGVDLGSASGDAVDSGDTTGAESYSELSCGPSALYGQALYDWSAPSEGCWEIDHSESVFDTVLSVWTADGYCGLSETCNDDTYGVQSSVSLELSEGEAVQILIHGYYAEGEYTLDINPCSE